MKRPAIIIGICVLAISAFSLFQVKYQVQYLTRDIQETRRQLAEEREALHVLKAEWSYLNRPERLEKLAQQYLKTERLNVAQVKNVGEYVTYSAFAANTQPATPPPASEPDQSAMRSE